MIGDSTIEVVVNGEPRAVPPGLSVTGLLLELGLEPRVVIVEHNGYILRRDRYDAVSLAPGDVLELVHFVGGGI